MTTPDDVRPGAPRPDENDSVLLETDRMTLRRFTDGDADELFALHDDSQVMYFLNGGRPASIDRIRTRTLPTIMSYYERFGNLSLWAAIDKATGEFLGWFELTPSDDTPPGTVPTVAELGYRLHRAAWGRGLATEGARALVHAAFTSMGIERVVADTMAVNTGSRRVMEKCGLRLESTYHTPWDGPEAPIDGHDQGEVLYALNREDWAAGLNAS